MNMVVYTAQTQQWLDASFRQTDAKGLCFRASCKTDARF